MLTFENSQYLINYSSTPLADEGQESSSGELCNGVDGTKRGKSGPVVPAPFFLRNDERAPGSVQEQSFGNRSVMTGFKKCLYANELPGKRRFVLRGK